MQYLIPLGCLAAFGMYGYMLAVLSWKRDPQLPSRAFIGDYNDAAVVAAMMHWNVAAGVGEFGGVKGGRKVSREEAMSLKPLWDEVEALRAKEDERWRASV